MIKYITIPNAALNICDDLPDNTNIEDGNQGALKDLLTEIMSKASFYSGDWEDFGRLLLEKQRKRKHPGDELSSEQNSSERQSDATQSCKFDVILTSETLYNPECHQKLLTLMTNCLSKSGVMYPL